MATTDTSTKSGGTGAAFAFVMICLGVMAATMAIFFMAWPNFALIFAIALAAWAIRVCRQRDLAGHAVALYWLGAALSLGLSFGGSVYGYGLSTALSTIGRQPTDAFARLWFVRGSWAGATVVLGSAALLAYIRHRVLGGGEIGIYLLGCALALAWAGFVQFGM